MKVTRELLKRYGLGLCTEQERKEIEKWFDTLDDPSSRLSKSFRPTFDDELIWSKMSKKRPQLSKTLNFKKAKNLLVFNSVVRYAAAACFALVVFFGGRFSVGTATASPTPKDPTANHLFIYGGDGAKGNLPGDAFEIDFDGTIKLYNNGLSNKTIIVGDSSFILESNRYYYLTGNIENANLKGYSFSKSDFEQPLKGGFLLSRIRD
ncbi:MAG: hypothetical protein AAGI25_16915 [Bacteroidota bacterium]